MPTIALQVLQFELHLRAQLAVQRGQRFIEQQHGGPVDQRARQGHALLLPAGQFIGAAFAKPESRTISKRLIRRLRNLGRRRFRRTLPQAIGHIVGHTQMGKQRIVLEHHVDRAAIGGNTGDIFAPNENLAFRRLLKPRHHAERRGLATTGRTEDREELARIHREIVVDHGSGIAEAFARRCEVQ